MSLLEYFYDRFYAIIIIIIIIIGVTFRVLNVTLICRLGKGTGTRYRIILMRILMQENNAECRSSMMRCDL